jgi:hypothetical protein
MLFFTSFSSTHQINIILPLTNSTAIHDQCLTALPFFQQKMNGDKFCFDVTWEVQLEYPNITILLNFLAFFLDSPIAVANQFQIVLYTAYRKFKIGYIYL